MVNPLMRVEGAAMRCEVLGRSGVSFATLAFMNMSFKLPETTKPLTAMSVTFPSLMSRHRPRVNACRC